ADYSSSIVMSVTAFIVLAPSSSMRLHLPPRSTLFPYTTLFRSSPGCSPCRPLPAATRSPHRSPPGCSTPWRSPFPPATESRDPRSEEHTSELQSPYDLVCRLLLEKKKHNSQDHYSDRTVLIRDL